MRLDKPVLAVAAVENLQRQSASQPIEHRANIREGEMNLRHVPLDHDVRKPAGGAQRLDVFLRGLRVAFVAERQRAVEK